MGGGAIVTRTHQRGPRPTSAGRFAPSIATRKLSYSVSLSATVASVPVPLVWPAAIVILASVP